MTSALATPADTGAAIAEQVIVKGDLSKLTEQERMSYYSEVCRSLGLNPLTRPFEYIILNNKLTLYATRGAADQLRSIRGISIASLDTRQVGDLLVVVATGRDRTGREDSSTGAVSVRGLAGEALANAMMKAETKAKRRLTLSLAGLGWPDETEVASIPDAIIAPQDKPLSLAERVAAKVAEVSTEPSPEEAVVSVDPVMPQAVPLAEGQEDFELVALDRQDTTTLTAEQFAEMCQQHRIDPKYATAVRKQMYPDMKSWSEVSDEQRAALMAEMLYD